MKPQKRNKKVPELENRRQAFQAKVQKRQEAIQSGLAGARADVERALQPVLEEIMAKRGANLVLDRGLVVFGPTDADITADVVKGLDAAMPTAPITLKIDE
jgi:Skp family chaperone for outer membrane proteins